MKVPVLVLDIRQREDAHYKNFDPKKNADELFEMMRLAEEDVFMKIQQRGSADVYEQCRLAHFHSWLLQDRDIILYGTKKGSQEMAIRPLWQIINDKQKFREQESEESSKRPMAKKIAEFLVMMEYRAYWALIPNYKRENWVSSGVVSDVENGWKQYFKEAMNEARLSY